MTPMNGISSRVFVYLVAVVLGVGQSAPDYGVSDLYYGFTLIDPAQRNVLKNAYVVVTAGLLTEIGSGDAPQATFRSRRDLAGRYGLPGFVDAHAHITAGPHTVEFMNGAPAIKMESVDDVTQFSARMALAFGVTTVRNPGGDPLANARYDQQIATGAWIGPDAVHAGAAVQPPPFAGRYRIIVIRRELPRTNSAGSARRPTA